MKVLLDKDMDPFLHLEEKARWVRVETLKIHAVAPGTRVASSLSPVEILVTLFYGRVLSYDPSNPFAPERDRFIVSKGHGSISLYPILADLGFFSLDELKKVGQEGSFLGAIPDPVIPGYETMNGSLGHGLGVACGIALGLERRGREESVFVLSGDGELYEGSVWEAVMFAGAHRLHNLNLIIDNNRVSMLGYCREIIDLEPLEEKFRAFGWDARRVDGHDLEGLYSTLWELKNERAGKPKVLIAETIKGKGVKILEDDPMSHVRSLSKEEVERAIMELEGRR